MSYSTNLEFKVEQEYRVSSRCKLYMMEQLVQCEVWLMYGLTTVARCVERVSRENVCDNNCFCNVATWLGNTWSAVNSLIYLLLSARTKQWFKLSSQYLTLSYLSAFTQHYVMYRMVKSLSELCGVLKF